jgi:hypothetical protein
MIARVIWPGASASFVPLHDQADEVRPVICGTSNDGPALG